MNLLVLANLSILAAQFLFLISISRCYGAEPLGIYSLALGIFAPANIFFTAVQRNTLLAGQHGPTSAASYSAVLTGRTLFQLLLILLAEVYGYAASISQETRYAVITVGMIKVAEGYLEFAYFFVIRSDNARRIASIAFLRSASPAIAAGLAYTFPVSFLTTLLIQLVLSFASVAMAWRAIEPSMLLPKLGQVNARTLRGVMRQSYSGALATIDSFLTILPRFFLSASGDLAAVGAYTLFTQLTMPINVIASSRLISDLAGRSRDTKSFDALRLRRASRALLEILIASAFVYVALAIAPNRILHSIFGDWFLDYRSLSWIVVALGVPSQFAGYLSHVELVRTGGAGALKLLLALAAAALIFLITLDTIQRISIEFVVAALSLVHCARIILLYRSSSLQA